MMCDVIVNLSWNVIHFLMNDTWEAYYVSLLVDCCFLHSNAFNKGFYIKLLCDLPSIIIPFQD